MRLLDRTKVVTGEFIITDKPTQEFLTQNLELFVRTKNPQAKRKKKELVSSYSCHNKCDHLLRTPLQSFLKISPDQQGVVALTINPNT